MIDRPIFTDVHPCETVSDAGAVVIKADDLCDQI
jgi:hypothetical protein